MVNTKTAALNRLKHMRNSFYGLLILTTFSFAQTLQVKGNNIVISNNDNSPDLTDNTDFGNVHVNNKSAKSFVLKNNSGTNLIFTGSSNVTLTGTNASSFSITTRPANNLTLSGFTYTILEVSFNPTSLGIKNATINITLSSGTPSPYTFSIQGTGIAPGNSDFSMTQLVPNGTFNYPYELIYGPDNYLWLTERIGKKIKRVNITDGTIDELVNLTSLVYQSGGQDGLLGMALHPNLLQSTGEDYVYIAYTYGTSDPTRKTKIVRYTYSQTGNDGTLSSPLELIANLPGSNDHNSGRLTIGPDNKLYYTIGDQGANQFANKCNTIKAQVIPSQIEIDASDYNSYQGKILRMNLDGTIPIDNPTINSVKSHIYSYGHRNAQGIVFASNGKLYSNEHGPKSDDEINIIQSGGNYGWPFVAGFRDDKNYAYCNWSTAPSCSSLSFSDYTCGTGATSTLESSWAGTFIDPITTLFTIDDGFNFTGGWLTWPTVGPSSIINYEGYANPIPGWDNSLLSTTLKKGKIYRSTLSVDGNSIIGLPEEILYTQNRYRDIAIHPNGKILYVITDSGGTTSGPSGSSSLSVINPGTIMVFTHETFLSSPNTSVDKNTIIAYNDTSNLMLKSTGEEILSVKIFDITGRLLVNQNNINSNSFLVNELNASKNILLIQVQTTDNIQISKKIIF